MPFSRVFKKNNDKVSLFLVLVLFTLLTSGYMLELVRGDLTISRLMHSSPFTPAITLFLRSCFELSISTLQSKLFPACLFSIQLLSFLDVTICLVRSLKSFQSPFLSNLYQVESFQACMKSFERTYLPHGKRRLGDG